MAAGVSLGAAFGRLRAARSGAGAAAVGVFGVRVGAAGFAYLAQVLMARVMGESEYGIFAAVWVWIAILGHAATLGLSQGACRFVPADQATGGLDAVRGFLIGGAAATAASGVAVAGLGLLGLRAEATLLAGPYGAPVLLGACVLPLFAFQDYLEGVARSQGWALAAIVPPYLLRQALIMLAMLAAIALGAPPRAEVAVAATLIATGVAVCVQAALLVARLRRLLAAGPRRYRWRTWLGAGLPIAAGDLATAAFGFVDVVVLGLFLEPAAVGLYFAATRIQAFVVFVHYAVSAATAQRLAAARAVGDAAGLTALVRAQARWTLIATAAVALAVVAAAPLLLSLFGPDFRAGLPVVAILAAGSVAASAFGPGEDILTMLGGERLGAGITLLMLAVGAGLCVLLVPGLGPTGAALAMAVAATLRGAAMAVGARAVHDLWTPAFPLPRWTQAR